MRLSPHRAILGIAYPSSTCCTISTAPVKCLHLAFDACHRGLSSLAEHAREIKPARVVLIPQRPPSFHPNIQLAKVPTYLKVTTSSKNYINPSTKNRSDHKPVVPSILQQASCTNTSHQDFIEILPVIARNQAGTGRGRNSLWPRTCLPTSDRSSSHSLPHVNTPSTTPMEYRLRTTSTYPPTTKSQSLGSSAAVEPPARLSNGKDNQATNNKNKFATTLGANLGHFCVHRVEPASPTSRFTPF